MSNIEAIAIKNLQGILRDRGYTAETLFSKYDSDGDGVISRNEFEGALSSITGQVAPGTIVNAVFGALDGDSSGYLELAELLSLVDPGTTHNFSEGQSIRISRHTNSQFNGTYSPQQSKINGRPFYKNSNGCMLYFYSSDSGSSPSWNLDDRTQDGSNDWYRGGWTRAPIDGSPPLGTKRWVGVGELSLVPNDGDAVETATAVNKDPEGSDLDALMAEIDMATNYFEGKVSEGEVSVDQAMKMADNAFERKVQDLPLFLRSPARKAWEEKTSELERRLRGKAPSPEAIAAGTAAIGVVGAVSGSVSENRGPSSSGQEPYGEKIEPKAEPEPDPEPDPDPEQDLTPVGLDLNEASSSFMSARTISERTAVKDSLSGNHVNVSFRVKSVERTFGIGISDVFRGGSTIIADVEGVGEVEIRTPSGSDYGHFRSGTESDMAVCVADWNAVRRRLVLESQ